MAQTILLSPSLPDDAGIIDLCRKVDQLVTKRWEFKALAADFWMLVAYDSDGIVDHPDRERAGGTEGKGLQLWHRRRHEILGMGRSPFEAARDILRGGRGARLRAEQVTDGSQRKRLLFYSLENGKLLPPRQLQQMKGN